MDACAAARYAEVVEKTKENMEGWYSPLPRLALAIIGPYAAKARLPSEQRSRFAATCSTAN